MKHKTFMKQREASLSDGLQKGAFKAIPKAWPKEPLKATPTPGPGIRRDGPSQGTPGEASFGDQKGTCF